MPRSASLVANPSAIFSPSFRSENLTTLTLHTSPSATPSSMSFVSVISRNSIANAEPAAADVFGPRSEHLKRKRPPNIHIPVAPLGYSAESPPARDSADETTDEGVGYCAYSKRGRRGPLEDRYSAIDICRDTNQAVFGVFDGHGGAKASEFAAENLNRNIAAALSGATSEEEMRDAIRDAYLITDEEFLKLDVNGGSCCVTAAFKNGNLAVSNVGDCRVVMSRGGVAEALTTDHKASREDERDRIEALGGYVDDCRGVWRIQGSLAVSRGVGDRHLKKWIIAEPETTVLKIEPDQEFLILASDGLWDNVSNQEAVDIVRSYRNGDEDVAGLSSACYRMAELSVSRGCIDDITVLVIQLGLYVS
uniref:protein-serine/threonine phosphatase n=1 Tax=Kalanchoe fedtschenkoi TaxID=63787 RepID=A0A7N0TXM0_KALFE